LPEIVVERSNDLINYEMVDGISDTQRNCWDCGVFSLMNIEREITTMETPIVQDLMMLYRCKILLGLMRQTQAIDRSGRGYRLRIRTGNV